MNTVQASKQDTKNETLLFEDLTYKVRGAVFTIYNALGFGHKEQVYQKALEREFKELKIPYTKEQTLKVKYRDEVVGFYISPAENFSINAEDESRKNTHFSSSAHENFRNSSFQAGEVHRPDFLVDEKIIIELKSLPSLPISVDSQILHYLKATGFSLGLLINFGGPKLFIKRLIWTSNQRKSAVNQR